MQAQCDSAPWGHSCDGCARHQIIWDYACVDAASVPASASGEHRGRNAADRGKLGYRVHRFSANAVSLLKPLSLASIGRAGGDPGITVDIYFAYR